MNFLRRVATSKIPLNILKRNFCPELNKQTTIASQLEFSHKKLCEPENVKAQEEITLLPVRHFQKTPAGSSIVLFCRMMNHWIGLPEKDVKEALKMVDDMFSSVTMMDDFVDGSTTRKNISAAHLVYGADHAVMGGVFGMCDVFDRMIEQLPLVTAALCVKNIKGFMRGNAIEVYWRNKYYCPDENEYIMATLLKWYLPLEVMVSMVVAKSDCQMNFDKLIKLISTLYAIINDYGDFYRSRYSEGKNFCDDLGEGKFTFPIIHAIKAKGNKEVYDMMCQRKKDIESRTHFLQLLESTGSLDYTRNYIRNLHKEIIEEIENLGGNPPMTFTMDKIIEECLGEKVRRI